MKRSTADERFTNGNDPIDQGLDIFKEWAALQPLDATVNRPPPILLPEEVEQREREQREREQRERDLAAFDAFATAPLDRARRDAASDGPSSQAFVDHLRWLTDMAPDIAQRYTAQMSGDELIGLVNPQRPGNLSLLKSAAPDLVRQRVQNAQDYFGASLRKQMNDQWGGNSFDDLHFMYLKDQGKATKFKPFAGGFKPFAKDVMIAATVNLRVDGLNQHS